MTDSTVTVAKPSKPATPAAKPAKRKAATDKKKSTTKQASKPATPSTTDKPTATKKPGRPPMTTEEIREKVDAALAKKAAVAATVAAVTTIYDALGHTATTPSGKQSTPLKPLETYRKSMRASAATTNTTNATERQTSGLLSMLVAQNKPLKTGVVIARVFSCPDPREKRGSKKLIDVALENGCGADMIGVGYFTLNNHPDDVTKETYKLTSSAYRLCTESTGGAAAIMKSGVKTS